MLPKRAYNAVHPFTSFIPIFCYMVLRNCSPTLRRYHMHLFAWCGKVTLETYILQFHIWMKTTGINGMCIYVEEAHRPPATPLPPPSAHTGYQKKVLFSVTDERGRRVCSARELVMQTAWSA